jgi:hypothetical protein
MHADLSDLLVVVLWYEGRGLSYQSSRANKHKGG